MLRCYCQNHGSGAKTELLFEARPPRLTEQLARKNDNKWL